jgi:oligopeptide/dipeptide ABC transporter ATP-binding protein
MSALLEVRDLRVRFRIGSALQGLLHPWGNAHIDAVCGVSLDIQECETLGVVGESGSGKSTLARAIIGLAKIAAGRVSFGGRDITHLGEREMNRVRANITMVFQDAVGSLSPRLTVQSLVTEPYRIQGLRDHDLRAECIRLLKLVGLPPDFAGRYPHQLSGGQARRVGVARALALEPKLLLADEPTAGLDVSVQGEILNLLAELRDKVGLSILIITHNLNVVRHVTSHIAIMYLGRIVESGPTDEIFANPRHPYTAALLSANPEPDPDANLNRIELEGEVPNALYRPSGCEFHTRCFRARDYCRQAPPTPSARGTEGYYTCHFPYGS